MNYDPKNDIIRCYEIKVTMQDFYSKAKKSWYGNYNYLVLSEELYRMHSVEEWKEKIPKNIGIIVINTKTLRKYNVSHTTKVEIDENQKEMLKSSLIRTLFYQNQNANWYLRKNNI